MTAITQNKVLSRKLASLLSRLSRDRRRVLEGGDPEALHDFRVTLRRLRALLGLLKGSYPPGRLAPHLAFLKKTAQATNELRDQEVLCSIWDSLGREVPSGASLRRWLASQDALRLRLKKKALAALASPILARRLLNLSSPAILGPMDKPDLARVYGRFKDRRRDLAKALKKALGSKREELLLHELRVEAKRVRYALEEWESLMPRRGRKLAAGCKKVQDALGEWRDLERARETLKGASLAPNERTGWMKELDARREAQWTRFKKAAKALRQRLD